MTNGRFTLPRLLVALVAAAMLFVGLAPAAFSDDVDTLGGRSAVADGGPSGRAIIPGFYPVDTIPSAAPTSGFSGMELDPDTGFLWSTPQNGNTVTIYDHARNVVDAFGSGGAGDGQFSRAGGIAISEGEVFIADFDNNRVQVFDTGGNHLRNISGGGITNPCGVEVVDDVVFMGSPTTIGRFTRNGSFLGSFNGSGSGTNISGACVADFLTSDGTEIFMSDFNNARVAVFDTTGTWLRSINVGGNPTSIDIDNQGNLWFTDFTAHTVETWTSAGAFVGQFDTSGANLGELDDPQGIVVDRSGGSFWVGESGANNRIQIFTSLDCDGTPLTHVGTSFSDVFDGTGNDDVVNLGKGFDEFNGLSGDDDICGGSGQDELSGGAGNDMILGGNGNDSILGGGGADFLDGKQGFDFLSGQGGNDTVVGSNGFDELLGGGGDDLLRGAMGNDTANGNAGSDEVNGGQGIDTVRGGGGDDDVNGQNGDDALSGGTGTDNCRGGNGTDTANTCEVTIGVP